MANTQKFWIWVCIFLGIAFQIQITQSIPGSLLPIRLNLADCALPILGLVIGTSLILGKSAWPKWYSKYTVLAIGLITTVLFTGIVTGYFYTGTWSTWALANKGIGWIVLLSHFALGAWIATNLSSEHIKIVLGVFITFFCFVGGLELVGLFIEHVAEKYRLFPINFPIAGLMDNRNAHALMFLCITSILYICHSHDSLKLPTFLPYAFSFLIPLFLIYNASRILWLALPVLFIAFVILNRTVALKTIILPLVPGILAVVLLLSMNFSGDIQYKYVVINTAGTANFIQNTTSTDFELDEVRESLPYEGDARRIVLLEHSLDLWKTSPILGVGLGSSQYEQLKDFDEILGVIDSTPLWALTEMGIIGLLVFSGFFIFCFYTIWASLKQREGIYKSLSVAMLLCLTVFGIMSLVHELTYTRHIWFLLGLTLAVPAKMHLQKLET